MAFSTRVLKPFSHSLPHSHLSLARAHLLEFDYSLFDSPRLILLAGIGKSFNLDDNIS